MTLMRAVCAVRAKKAQARVAQESGNAAQQRKPCSYSAQKTRARARRRNAR